MSSPTITVAEDLAAEDLAASRARASWREVHTQLAPDALELLHLVVARHSREQMKRLSLVELPPHAGLVLVFDAFGAPATWVDDWSGKTLCSRIEIDELVADQLQLRRTRDGEELAKIAKRIRRRWVALVDHAIGYRVPGSLDILEFSQ